MFAKAQMSDKIDMCPAIADRLPYLLLVKCRNVKSLTMKLRDFLHPHVTSWGDRGGTVVKVLCYKSEGCWFDPSWCH